MSDLYASCRYMALILLLAAVACKQTSSHSRAQDAAAGLPEASGDASTAAPPLADESLPAEQGQSHGANLEAEEDEQLPGQEGSQTQQRQSWQGEQSGGKRPLSHAGLAWSKDEKSQRVQYNAPEAYFYPDTYNELGREGYVPKRHLLVWQQDPATEAIINWGLDIFNAQHEHIVYYSTSPHYGQEPALNYEGKVLAQESGMLPACRGSEHANLQAKLSGLTPNTTYYYVVSSNGQRSREMHFVTAPASEQVSFKLIAGGDSRSDRYQRRIMNGYIKKLMEEDSSYLAMVHGGDFVATGARCEDWLGWRDDHQYTVSSQGRMLPLVATFGNHEVGGEEQFMALFGSPEGAHKFYFHTRIGRLDLLTLNSEVSVEGDQMTWLNDKLAALSRLPGRFLVAGYHRPAWPAQKRPADTVAWIPLFERYKVDLVLESDGHVLKQTCPIVDGACSNDLATGIVYVGEGGLGVPQRGARRSDAWYFRGGGYAFGQHHIQSLTFTSGMSVATSALKYQVYYNEQFHHELLLPLKVRN